MNGHKYLNGDLPADTLIFETTNHLLGNVNTTNFYLHFNGISCKVVFRISIFFKKLKSLSIKEILRGYFFVLFYFFIILPYLCVFFVLD